MEVGNLSPFSFCSQEKLTLGQWFATFQMLQSPLSLAILAEADGKIVVHEHQEGPRLSPTALGQLNQCIPVKLVLGQLLC